MSQLSSTKFDPYYRWLGIPPEEQPANHYRLLGVSDFEEDLEVIAVAADRQMAHVKTFSAGQYSEQSQGLLDELARARVTLLNPREKQKYDSQLRIDRETVVPVNAPHALKGIQEALHIEQCGRRDRQSASEGSKSETGVRILPHIEDLPSISRSRTSLSKTSWLSWVMPFSLFLLTMGIGYTFMSRHQSSAVRDCFVSMRLIGKAVEGGPGVKLILEQSLPLQTDTYVDLEIKGKVSLGNDISFSSHPDISQGELAFVIPAGSRLLEIPIRIIDDSEVEGPERAVIKIAKYYSPSRDVSLEPDSQELLLSIEDNDKAILSLHGSADGANDNLQSPKATISVSAASSETLRVRYSWKIVSIDYSDGSSTTSTGKGITTIPRGDTQRELILRNLLDLSDIDRARVTVRLESVTARRVEASINPSQSERGFNWYKPKFLDPSVSSLEKSKERQDDNDNRFLHEFLELYDLESPLGQFLAYGSTEEFVEAAEDYRETYLFEQLCGLFLYRGDLVSREKETIAQLLEAKERAAKQREKQDEVYWEAISKAKILTTKESNEETIRELKKIKRLHPERHDIEFEIGLSEARFAQEHGYDSKRLKNARSSFAIYIGTVEKQATFPRSIPILNLQRALNNHAIVSTYLQDYRKAYMSWKKALEMNSLSMEIYSNFEKFATGLKKLNQSNQDLLATQVENLRNELQKEHQYISADRKGAFKLLQLIPQSFNSDEARKGGIQNRSWDTSMGGTVQTGWGFAVDREHIVTHRCLIEIGNSIRVRDVQSRRNLAAQIVSREGDLVLVRVRGLRATPIPLADDYPSLHERLDIMKSEIDDQGRRKIVASSFVGIIEPLSDSMHWPHQEHMVFRSSEPLQLYGCPVISTESLKVVGMISPSIGFRENIGLAIASPAIRKWVRAHGIQNDTASSKTYMELTENIRHSTYELEARIP